jgi:hypothetical protein
MGRPKILEGRSISARLSGELETLFDAEKALHRGISDAALGRELIDEALRARAAMRA